MALPVSYGEFIKHPLMATMYCLIAAIGAMYIDIRIANSDQKKEYRKQIIDCKTETYMLNVKVDQLAEKMRISDSIRNKVISKLETLQELKVIQ